MVDPTPNRVKVTLSGCDDETTFVIDATEEQWSFLTRIGLLSEQASDYGCMPILSVTDGSTVAGGRAESRYS